MALYRGLAGMGGTKSAIIYHTIMFVLNVILLVIAIGLYIFSLLDKEFRFGSPFLVILFLILTFVYNSQMKDDTDKYVKTAGFRLASKNPTKIDNLIMKLVNHHNRKWIPASYMCCSFSFLEPNDAHNSQDLSLVKYYRKYYSHSDYCCCLYQCKKCRKYVLSIESIDDNIYFYIPIKNPEEAAEYSKMWEPYSIYTQRPILHGYENFWTWRNKNTRGNTD